MGTARLMLFSFQRGKEMMPRPRRLAPVFASLAALALLLAGCGSVTTPTGSSSSPALTCATVLSGHSVDVVTAQLTCHVTGADPSDTSFSLQYRVTDDSGSAPHFTATCSGALRNGSGSCTQSYSAPVPRPLTPASVSGETTPGRQPLGPVTPTERTATPAPGQHL